MSVFSSAYFPPIRYMADFLQAENPLIDGFENMQKQTYRNRCYILGPNGRQMLIVPTARNNESRRVKDIRISYAENWQKEHYKSLEAAYRRSPYFEYYEHIFETILKTRYNFLFELNNAIMEQILNLLQADVQIKLTESYKADFEIDKRDVYKAKSEPVQIPVYAQVFEEKIPFESGLSIIDLICNQGPQSIIYLKNLNCI